MEGGKKVGKVEALVKETQFKVPVVTWVSSAENVSSTLKEGLAEMKDKEGGFSQFTGVQTEAGE